MERTNATCMLRNVLDAYEEVFRKGDDVFADEPPSDEIIQSVLENSLEIVFWNDLKAFCFFRRTDIYTYHIEYLGVKNNFAGRGLGGRLLKIVIELCRENDPLVREITLLCPDNRISFYEKHGFVFSNKVVEGTRKWNKMSKPL
jgi:ribosomal protein S18 acetylase RimI-like enzyme